MNIKDQFTYKSPYVILSFPRSGSHYLEGILMLIFGIRADKVSKCSEILVNDRKIIAIVRNPIDAITSKVTKTNHWTIEKYFIENAVSEYIQTMDEIYSNADIVVNFDELIANEGRVIGLLSKALGAPAFDNHFNLSVKVNRDKHIYTPSSKGLEGYDEVKAAVSDYDLSLATEAYNRVLTKALA